MRPKIRQWFESWFFRTDHWIGHDQVASHKLERIAEKAFRAGFERGRHFQKCQNALKGQP